MYSIRVRRQGVGVGTPLHMPSPVLVPSLFIGGGMRSYGDSTSTTPLTAGEMGVINSFPIWQGR